MEYKRYWLRGGIIGLAVAVVTILVLISSSSLSANDVDIRLKPGVIDSLDYYPPSGVLVEIAKVSQVILRILSWPFIFLPGLPVVFGITFLIIHAFLIGALLGWLYGKIKNRKS